MKAYLEPDEVEKLERAADFLRDKLLIRLLWRLGCRVSEVLGITVDNIDFKQGTITIEHLKARIKLSCPSCGAGLGKSHKFCPVCGLKVEKAVAQEKEHHRYRCLPVDKDTLDLLKEYIKRGGAVSRNGKKIVFNLTRHRAWQIIRKCSDIAGLPQVVNAESGKEHGVSPHKLRDAFAVHAVKLDDSGDGLRLLQEHLGHQSIVTTMKYRKVSGEEQKEWYDKLWQGGNKNG
ncbi:tyrosine-type recombinase/integrase [Dehalococcoides mccartyi]|uniref:Site-specific recombinase, phage integrase family n=1 Tax=Dehalococcoides mccartyi (strain VS) TaxID=311424 RepID=D2BGF2_DEHMV|nr:tyrosine-type recombinase/integrase [Dehalococcoides mccartyi]ACZ61402.1 site-specific recombinase, phage integrase family [Dehalococcoides mccartyi VS]